MAGPDDLIGDADRQREIDRLRASTAEGRLTLDEFSDRVGAVYAARTRADLVGPTADLPVVAESSPIPARRWAVGVLSGARQSGRWRPDEHFRAVAVLGSVQVDLCNALVGAQVDIEAWAVLGGVEILVPEGVHVALGGFAFLGGRDYRVRESSLRPGTPVVHVRARAVLGGVTVRTKPFTARR